MIFKFVQNYYQCFHTISPQMRPVSSWLYFALHKCTVWCGRVCSAAESGAAVLQCAAAELGQKTRTAAAASLQSLSLPHKLEQMTLHCRLDRSAQSGYKPGWRGKKYSIMTFSLQRSLCVGRCSGDSGGLQQNCSCRCSSVAVTAAVRHTLLPPPARRAARQVVSTRSCLMQFMIFR